MITVDLPDGYWVVDDAHAHKGGSGCFDGMHYTTCGNSITFDVEADDEGNISDISHVIFIFAKCSDASSTTTTESTPTTTTVDGTTTTMATTTTQLVTTTTTTAPTFDGCNTCESTEYFYFKYDTNDAGTVVASGLFYEARNINTNICNPINDWLAANNISEETIQDSTGLIGLSDITIASYLNKPNGIVTVNLPDGYWVVQDAHAHKGGTGCFGGMHFTTCANSVTFNVEADDEGNVSDISHVVFIFAKCGDGSATTTSTNPTTATSSDPTFPGGGGGDPHFQRWGQSHSSFHGECDLVMVHSDAFHDHAGLDLHARTTIDTFYSYIESAALRVGDYTLEITQEGAYINSVLVAYDDFPMTFGDDYRYTLTMIQKDKYVKKIRMDLGDNSHIIFKFYKHYLTKNLAGTASDFGDSVGLLGEYGTGTMISRDGEEFDNFHEFGFEWQVSPEDPQLFREARSPQLPFEVCRLPTAARPGRRNLRASNNVLLDQAELACAHITGSDFNLCVDDVMMTGDLGLVESW